MPVPIRPRMRRIEINLPTIVRRARSSAIVHSLFLSGGFLNFSVWDQFLSPWPVIRGPRQTEFPGWQGTPQEPLVQEPFVPLPFPGSGPYSPDRMPAVPCLPIDRNAWIEPPPPFSSNLRD